LRALKMLERITLGGLDMLASDELLEKGIVVAFTGREGGSSRGEYSSLNLSYDVGDAPDAVTENRRAVASALRLPLERWILGRQVHGARVCEVSPLDVGRGSRDFRSGIPRTDALVTDLRDSALGVLTADCVPVAMAAPGRVGGRAVAVAHCGWRGVVAGTAPAAMRALCRYAGCPADEILVFIGPHIRSCCLEVGDDVASIFRGRFGGSANRPGDDGRTYLDLEKACELQLLAEGASADRVFCSEECTSCGAGYFSFRGSGGVCGRQGAFAAVLGADRSS
jgi:purine-nucleoside/S-methyl-5'-thioadenosine phosphorylase / adenosine deaminase